MGSVSIVDVIFIAGVSQGIFLTLSLHFLKNDNREANRVLIQILLLSILMLIGNLLSFNLQYRWAYNIAVLADIIIFLSGPLVYLYVRRLAFKEIPRYRLSYQDYIFPSLYLVYFLWFIFTSGETHLRLHKEKTLEYFHKGVELAGILSLGYYLFRSYQLARFYKENEKQQLSNTQSLNSFFKSLLITLTICLLLWFLSFIQKSFTSIKLPYFNYSVLWVSISFFIYVVGFYSLRQPSIFRIPFKKNSLERARLKPKEVLQMQKRLDYFFDEESVFLEPNITLKSLSDLLNTTPNNLSWLFNNIYHLTFSEFVNKYRVELFLKKVANGEHLKKTLLAIALESGFNSKSNFNKVFKEQVGTTPSAYIKKRNVA